MGLDFGASACYETDPYGAALWFTSVSEVGMMLTEAECTETIGIRRRVNLRYYREHGDDLRRDYLGKYVVIFDGAVQAAVDKPQELTDALAGLSDHQVATAVIKYISPKDEVYIA